jgi:hypothetical protein
MIIYPLCCSFLDCVLILVMYLTKFQIMGPLLIFSDHENAIDYQGDYRQDEWQIDVHEEVAHEANRGKIFMDGGVSYGFCLKRNVSVKKDII